MFDIRKITKEQQMTSSWAGGTTTQFAIYPEDSNYVNRDFMWRLSSAVVELEESAFTSLPGFDRHLMVLEGKLKLEHKDHHSIMLNQYEHDSFKGCWDTVSYGRATDFNLMLKEGKKGRLEHYSSAAGQLTNIHLEIACEKQGFFALFCYKGQMSIEAKDKIDTLAEGELLIISYEDRVTVTAKNNANKECSLIAAFIEI